MTLASVDNQSVASEYFPLGLQVILLKRTYVFPWSQFLYAEGSNDELHLIFSTHDILIKGRNLSSLASDLAAHRVARLQEPFRPDRFLNETGVFIREISIQQVGQYRA